jgi:hypothetical protein
MDIVVDVECFYGNIIKELSFCTYTGYSECFLFKPPHTFEQCSEIEKIKNSWFSRNIHQIAWNAGFYDYSERDTIIKVIAKRPGAHFYAKGEETCKLLARLFGINFTNLEDLDCPDIEELMDEGWGTQIKCDSYPGRHNGLTRCAQRKARIYSNWLREYDDVFAILL